LKIALLGYGKMGQIIEKIAVSRGHEIVWKKNRTTTYDSFQEADIAIEFSVPEMAVEHLEWCLSQKVPVVCGTTGWLSDYERISEKFTNEKGSLIYASNFSLGVNIFFELNRKLAQMMSPYPEYSIQLKEIHHTQKLDAPSGTALSLANDVLSATKYTSWKLGETNEETLGIDAERIGQVPGTHYVTYKSEIDTISIMHEAHNRNGFALGAVIAAEWLFNKKGVFTMKDVLSL
jgi:4-hydroxy-tetrahydrodipicolinate reductase